MAAVIDFRGRQELAIYNVDTLSEIDLGRQGENLARTVEIDVQSMLTQWPGAEISLLVKRNGDNAPYIANTSVSDGVLIWPVTAADTEFAGYGRIEVRATLGNTIAKSVMGVSRVASSITGQETEPPESAQSWVGAVLAAGNQAQKAEQEAQKAAREAKEAADQAMNGAGLDEVLSGYVRAEEGKGLSSNDFTDLYKAAMDSLGIETLTETTKIPYDDQDTSTGHGSLGSKTGFFRNYCSAALSDATAVDIYIPYNADNGPTTATLFVNLEARGTPSVSSVSASGHLAVVTVEAAGWYRLDLGGISLHDIGGENGIISAGFFMGGLTSQQLYSMTGPNNSPYYADTKLWSFTTSGNAYTQNASTGNTVHVVWYHDQVDEQITVKKQITAVTDEQRDKTLRVALVSDIHYKADASGDPPDDDTYDLERGVNGAERMQNLVDAINAEHRARRIDFVVIAGDIRTLTSGNKSQKNDDLRRLCNDWLSQLEMPCFMMRGNHDAYSNREWEDCTGNKPQFSVETDDYYFLCVDAYDHSKAIFGTGEGQEPQYKYDGTDLYYTGFTPQMGWIKKQVGYAKAAGKKVWIVAHYLYHNAVFAGSPAETVDETAALELIQNEDSILGIILGHAHIPLIQKSFVRADAAANGGAGYNIPKWYINTGNYGNIPCNGSGVTPAAYRCGFEILEMQADGLWAHHVYPAMSYPRWKSEATQGAYAGTDFAYEVGSDTCVDSREKHGGADYRIPCADSAHLHRAVQSLAKRICTLESKMEV